MPDLLTEAEAAALLRRSRRHVRQLRQAGELQWLPGAGRAPLLITRESLNQYIERALQWHASNSRLGSSKALATTGTSPSPMVAALSEQAFGRQIFKSRKRGFRAG
jgi:MarR-like DNA-binding transcriptional regulator SgrR of sgrS sRNA